jgi:hypothetical protein
VGGGALQAAETRGGAGTPALALAVKRTSALAAKLTARAAKLTRARRSCRGAAGQLREKRARERTRVAIKAIAEGRTPPGVRAQPRPTPPLPTVAPTRRPTVLCVLPLLAALPHRPAPARLFIPNRRLRETRRGASRSPDARARRRSGIWPGAPDRAGRGRLAGHRGARQRGRTRWRGCCGLPWTWATAPTEQACPLSTG